MNVIAIQQRKLYSMWVFFRLLQKKKSLDNFLSYFQRLRSHSEQALQTQDNTEFDQQLHQHHYGSNPDLIPVKHCKLS